MTGLVVLIAHETVGVTRMSVCFQCDKVLYRISVYDQLSEGYVSVAFNAANTSLWCDLEQSQYNMVYCIPL